MKHWEEEKHKKLCQAMLTEPCFWSEKIKLLFKVNAKARKKKQKNKKKKTEFIANASKV